LARLTPAQEEVFGVQTSAVPDTGVPSDTPLGRRQWWLHIQTDGGEEGWVAAEFLDWAE
jgi:hypothetical protein